MILNMYKPKGWTSFDVVKKVRSITKEKKVGHGGTLDPFAEGVLVLGTGSDTKKLGMISDSNKEYVATLKLGSRTDTHDIEGHVVEDKAIPTLTLEEVETVLKSFIGEQYQTPPMYSAKKVNGQRLYKLARKNIEIEREPCLIKIVDIELIHFNSPVIEFSVTCSKGTYIRVLGTDIANQLGTVGHLIALKRKKVGEYAIDETIQIDDLVSNGCF
jgi:tRNA pseudouridine55 synthase